MMSKGTPSQSISVEFSRQNGTLDEDDLDTIKLLVYLAHSHPSYSHASSEESKRTGVFSGRSNTFDVHPRDPWAMASHFLSHHPAMDGESLMFIETSGFQEDDPSIPAEFSRDMPSPLGTTTHDKTLTGDTDRRVQQVKTALENMGILVSIPGDTKEDINWSQLPGYDHVKRIVEETLVMTFSHSDILKNVAQQTRGAHEDVNFPRMLLFNGPPGTGKTTTARILANSIHVPLLYIPVESVVSKWFGESEKNLGKIFDLAKYLGQTYNGCILFIDEVDSVASSRDDYTLHEASKRMLSILLRRLDGFDTQKDKTILICATNREKELDEAFRSRIDVTVMFPLPSKEARRAITRRYAQHLNDKDLEEIVVATEGLSGRNIRDFCLKAERSWVATLLKKKDSRSNEAVPPPPKDYYFVAAKEKIQQQKN